MPIDGNVIPDPGIAVTSNETVPPMDEWSNQRFYDYLGMVASDMDSSGHHAIAEDYREMRSRLYELRGPAGITTEDNVVDSTAVEED